MKQDCDALNLDGYKYGVGVRKDKNGGVATIDLWYSGLPGNVHTLDIGLMDVRASDAIRVTYDFDRDGYVIMQCRLFLERIGDHSYEEKEDWIEVGFFQSWALQPGHDSDTELHDILRKECETTGYKVRGKVD